MSPGSIARAVVGIVLLGNLACSPVGMHDSAPVLAEDIPRTQQPFLDKSDDLRFLVVGDRTGGHRPGVFGGAMDRINGLRPELVMSVGDLIEGYQTDPTQLAREWATVNAHLQRLHMPFFYVAGNHDISNPVMARWWRTHLGRDYYYFVYKNALFIALNTEDPPTAQQRKEQLAGFPPVLLQRAARLAHLQPEEARVALAREPELARAAAVLGSDQATIGRDQRGWLRKVLTEHPDVRWTFVFMHKPAWRYAYARFEEIEALLKGRPYTVFAGHYHYYQHEQREGRDYIQMGATGGVRGLFSKGPGDMDHVLWVTLSDGGPVLAPIELDGLHGVTGPADTGAEPASP